MKKIACYWLVAIATLGACTDTMELDEVDQEVLFDRELRLRKIRAITLNEDADEIYMTAKATTQTGMNVIRPSGDPDYWLFEEPGSRTMNERIGKAKADGTIVTIKLMEQDNATLGNPHDVVGFFDVFQTDSAGVVFVQNQHAEHLGVNVDGWHVMELTQDGRYRVYIEIL